MNDYRIGAKVMATLIKLRSLMTKLNKDQLQDAIKLARIMLDDLEEGLK